MAYSLTLFIGTALIKIRATRPGDRETSQIIRLCRGQEGSRARDIGSLANAAQGRCLVGLRNHQLSLRLRRDPGGGQSRGHIGHALVGAVMIGVIRNALNLLGVEIFYQMIAIGVIVVVAVEADVLRSHLEGRARVLQAVRGQ